MLRVVLPHLLAGVAAASGVGFGALLTPAWAQAAQLVVEHAGPDTITAAIGERGSIAFRITNHGEAVVIGTAEVSAPGGWRVVAPASEVEIASGSTVLQVVSFYPANTAAGDYSFQLEFRSRLGPSAHDLVQIRVPERPRLDVVLENAPQWSTAGDAFSLLARVTNSGNVSTYYGVRLSSPYEIPARTDTTSRWLEPGGSESFTIEVNPPPDLPRAIMHSMTVTAAADGVAAAAVSRVEILPGPRASREPRGGVPAEIRLRASEDPRAGPPIRFFAAGPIRPGSRTRVSALLQGPIQTYSLFGEADVYSFSVASPSFSLDLGDHLFRLSRLTEPGQQGIGLAGSAHWRGFAAGGYVQRDRRSFSPDSQIAVFTSFAPTQHLMLRANWLRTQGNDGRREVISGEGSVHVPRWFSIRAELGARPSTGAIARSADLSAHRGPFTLNLRHLDGDTAYGGLNAGLSIRSAHLSMRPWRSLYFETAVQDQLVDRAVGSIFSSSRQRSARVAAGWGSALSIEGQSLERTSRLGSTHITRGARSVLVRLGVPLGPLTLYPSAEYGVGEAVGSDEVEPYWRAGARTSLSTAAITLSSNLEYFTGGMLHRNVEEKGLAGTGTAVLRFMSTNVRVSGRATRYLAPQRRDNFVIDAGLGHILPFGHTISARIFRRAASGLFHHDDVVALLDYSIPLKIPTGARSRAATVTGRVYDSASGAPLPRVILRVGGRRIVTDRNGRFRASGLEPGAHYVDMDRSTSGPGRIASVAMPMRIELNAGERQNLDLALLPAGSITVQTTIARATSASGRAGRPEAEPMERVTVDFQSGDQRIRRQSDSRGIIDVRDLRPGPWTVTVANAELPAFYRFDRDSITVRVASGAQSDLSFAASPVQRRIEIVTTADVVESWPVADSVGTPVVETRTTRAAPAAAAAHVLGMPVDQAPPVEQLVASRPPARRAAEPRVLGTPVLASPPAGTDRPRTEAADPSGRVASPPGITVTVTASDRTLRSIAALVYGDRELWPRIWLANRDALSHPDRLFTGQVLRIPPAGPLTPEERAIARRYPEP